MKNKFTGKRKIGINFDCPIPPTRKQLDFISDIETYTGVEFEGNTIEDASEYISENIEEYYFQKDIDEIDEDDPPWYSRVGDRN